MTVGCEVNCVNDKAGEHAGSHLPAHSSGCQGAEAARAILGLYRAYQAARSTADDLSTRLRDGEAEPQPDGGRAPSHIPSEEVSDYLQRVGNHFPDLEAAAEQLAARAKLTSDDLY